MTAATIRELPMRTADMAQMVTGTALPNLRADSGCLFVGVLLQILRTQGTHAFRLLVRLCDEGGDGISGCHERVLIAPYTKLENQEAQDALEGTHDADNEKEAVRNTESAWRLVPFRNAVAYLHNSRDGAEGKEGPEQDLSPAEKAKVFERLDADFEPVSCPVGGVDFCSLPSVQYALAESILIGSSIAIIGGVFLKVEEGHEEQDNEQGWPQMLDVTNG
ncbi:hypothetical protein HG530_012302 [Fusarium avenaceum]|nr:hypothetical protein HG530_012302 [Fusarium avenaceum]